MSYVQPRAYGGDRVRSSATSRSTFIVRTYGHLLAAVLAFTALEVFLFTSGLAFQFAQGMAGNWLLVMGAFVVTGWLASHFALSARSSLAQYAGLGLYVVAEAIIFVPLLLRAQLYAPGAIQSAGLVTALGFTGLSAIAFWTRKDFSFLGGLLKWGFLMALVAIVAGLVFGFQLGVFFSIAMVGLAGAAILWDTSNVIHHFPTDRHVGAALQLFSSVALMFFYVLRLVLSSSRD